jgi:SAM-dependent methyltransferase
MEMGKRNAFNQPLYDPREVIRDERVEKAVRSMLCSVLTSFDLPKREAQELASKSVAIAKASPSLEKHEEGAYKILKESGITEQLAEKFSERAEIKRKQIVGYLVKGSVLDFGCGDGRVGETLSKMGFDVTLTDVYENSHIKDTSLPFRLLDRKERIPFKNGSFDNVIALVVYHHSEDPIHSLKESARVLKKGGKLVVIESVYGIDDSRPPGKVKSMARAYFKLNREQQRKTSMFHDHFSNRIFRFTKNKKFKVNVPFNFNTPENWEVLFERHGLKQERKEYLGFDQPTAAEFHVLYVLSKD